MISKLSSKLSMAREWPIQIPKLVPIAMAITKLTATRHKVMPRCASKPPESK